MFSRAASHMLPMLMPARLRYYVTARSRLILIITFMLLRRHAADFFMPLLRAAALSQRSAAR